MDDRAERLADMFEVDQRLHDDRARAEHNARWRVIVDQALVARFGVGLDELPEDLDYYGQWLIYTTNCTIQAKYGRKR